MSSSMKDTKKLSRQGGNPRPSTYVIMYCTVEIWCLFMKTTCCLSFQGNLIFFGMQRRTRVQLVVPLLEGAVSPDMNKPEFILLNRPWRDIQRRT
jgi:hypothetical protein